jgi:hypothetical protein
VRDILNWTRGTKQYQNRISEISDLVGKPLKDDMLLKIMATGPSYLGVEDGVKCCAVLTSVYFPKLGYWGSNGMGSRTARNSSTKYFGVLPLGCNLLHLYHEIMAWGHRVSQVFRSFTAD